MSRDEEKETGEEKEREKEKGKETASDFNTPWITNFITPNKKQILKSDSLQEDPSLAFTLQSGLALPRDIQSPQSLKMTLKDYYFYVGRVSYIFYTCKALLPNLLSFSLV